MRRNTPRHAALALALASASVCAVTPHTWGFGSAHQASAATATSPNEAKPPLRDLYPEGTTTFNLPPPIEVWAPVKCDLNGDIFLAYTSFPPSTLGRPIAFNMNPPIHELIAGSDRAVTYSIPSLPNYEDVRRSTFNVGPRGQLYALLEAYHHKPTPKEPQAAHFLIVKYRDDGTMDDFVELENPPAGNFEPYRFAAFGDGSFLVTGAIDASTPGTPQKPFTGIFARDGSFSMALTFKGDVRPAPKSRAAKQGKGKKGPASQSSNTRSKKEYLQDWVLEVGEGMMLAAPDGNIYIVRSSNPVRIFAISTAGKIVRQFTVASPNGATVSQAGLAGQSDLLLDFLHVPGRDNAKSASAMLVTVDIETGKELAAYHLPRKGGGIAACGTPQEEIYFVGKSENNKLQVRTFAAR